MPPCGTNTGENLPEQPSTRPFLPDTTIRTTTTTTSVFPVALVFEDVAYKVDIVHQGWWINCKRSTTEKTILKGISGQVRPGELLAMLGPSGSGKTTLLTALGSRLPGKISGTITYNGRSFDSSLKRRTGFVAQDDVLYPHLTVTETLVFTALLRLPRTLAREEKLQQVQQVITELGLGKVAHSMIGGQLVRGVSGGERKRVSIGQEMLVNPSLLLLDEPTSGLDSTTAQRIIMMLKRLAAQGRTVVTTIHQPSSRIYHMFDKVILLSQGSSIYYGRASEALDYFSSIGFSSPVSINPADHMLDLANGISPASKSVTMEQGDVNGSSTEEEEKLVRKELIAAYDCIIATRLKAELRESNNCNENKRDPPNFRGKTEQWSTSWWEQFRVLLSRSLKERRFETFNKLRIFQVLSVAILGGLLWWHTTPNRIQDRIALLFFFSVFWGFFPLYNAVFTFPQEKRILVKEQSSGMYHLSSYFLARTAGDLPMELALPTAFVTIIYWMGTLKPSPLSFFLSLLVVLYNVLVSQSLGLAFGAILMDVKQAATLASVTTMVFLIAGGYYVQQIPPFIVWFKDLSYSFYCYKLLLGVQFSEGDEYECSSGVMCRVMDYPAIKTVGLNHLWIDVCIMALMLVGYRLVAYMALQRLKPK